MVWASALASLCWPTIRAPRGSWPAFADGVVNGLAGPCVADLARVDGVGGLGNPVLFLGSWSPPYVCLFVRSGYLLTSGSCRGSGTKHHCGGLRHLGPSVVTVVAVAQLLRVPSHGAGTISPIA
jgi:hypothetical protein